MGDIERSPRGIYVVLLFRASRTTCCTQPQTRMHKLDNHSKIPGFLALSWVFAHPFLIQWLHQRSPTVSSHVLQFNMHASKNTQSLIIQRLSEFLSHVNNASLLHMPTCTYRSHDLQDNGAAVSPLNRACVVQAPISTCTRVCYLPVPFCVRLAHAWAPAEASKM